MEAKLTMFGMEQYMQSKGDSLFKDIQIPTENGCDKDTLVDTILLSAGEFDTLYPNPYFMKSAISVFFRKNFSVYDKWFYNQTYLKQYNPIENYEEIREAYTNKNDFEKSGSNKTTNNLTETTQSTVESEGTNSTVNDLTQTLNTKNTTTTDGEVNTTNGTTRTPNLTTENQVSAFDSSTYVNKDKTVQSGTEGTTTTGKTEDDTTVTTDNTGTVKDTGTVSGAIDNTTVQNGTNKQTGTVLDEAEESSTQTSSYGEQRVHGNMGVKTAGEMLRADSLGQLNLYEMIADQFVSEFCILLY